MTRTLKDLPLFSSLPVVERDWLYGILGVPDLVVTSALRFH